MPETDAKQAAPSMQQAASRTPRALSIAGSDSGGGAGIQADIKAFARCGVHGMTAITAITAQSTVGVEAIHQVPGEIVLAQVRAVLADIGVDAVKVGMLGSRETILAVAQALDELPSGTPVVVDPVMISESGSQLLAKDAKQALIEEILPRASVLTPNVPEAEAITGMQGGDEDADRALVAAVLRLGPDAVVLTGGHRKVPADLMLRSGEREPTSITGERHPAGASHGSGCTHSSLLAAQLALGRDLGEAATIARRLAGEAVGAGLRDVGAGAGPVDVLGLAKRR